MHQLMAPIKMTRVAIILLLPFFMVHLGCSRHFTSDDQDKANLLSDGINANRHKNDMKLAAVEGKVEDNVEGLLATVTCEATYGFLPCTTKLWGQLFLVLVYEYLLSLGGHYVSAGSDLFFQLVGPGIFGASLFQILGTIPRIVLVLASGLSGNIKTAEQQARMGMGLLAGSAVMNLTLIWGSCVAFGSYNLSEFSSSSENEQKRSKWLAGYGLITDVETSYTARIMTLSMVPFLILQLAKIINSYSGIRVTILVSLLVTIAFLFAYSFYQAFQPSIQHRIFEYLTQKFVKDKLLRLLSIRGKPNIPLIKELFHGIDKNNDAHISRSEMRVLILGIQLQEDGLVNDDYVETVMNTFDISGDARISEEEFVKVISSWLSKAAEPVDDQNHKHQISGNNGLGTAEEQQMLVAPTKDNRNADMPWWNYIKAIFLVLLGTTILSLLARPLVQAIGDFATEANIPPFFVSYIVIPLALNYRSALLAITSAKNKTPKSISLTLSQIYGAAIMNNLVGLVVFLALVYIRDLSWDVSAEVLVVLIICTLVGLIASFHTKIPIWTSLLAYLLYPISLLLLYILTSVLGWS